MTVTSRKPQAASPRSPHSFRKVHPSWPGELAIHRTPSAARFAVLAAEGCTEIVSLLNPQASREKNLIKEISTRARATGIEWVFVPIRDAVNLIPSERELVLSAVVSISARLRAGRKIYLHCSAGRNRSRMVAHAVMLAGGVAESEALACIRSMRPTVAAPLSDSRRWLAADLARAAILMSGPPSSQFGGKDSPDQLIKNSSFVGSDCGGLSQTGQAGGS